MKTNSPTKTLVLGLLFAIFFSFSTIAQVGIGTTDPKTELDVDGALSLREGPELTLNANNTNTISLNTSPYSSYRIDSPGDFGIRRINAATNADGQLVTLINTTSFQMTLRHAVGSGSNRIYCPGGSDVVLTGIYAAATLQYNDSLNRWVLINTNSTGGASSSDDWTTTGNTGTTAGTHFLGTKDNVSLELFTDDATRMRVEDDGQISMGFGATAVNANEQFNVGSTFTNGTAIGGYGTGTGYGVYGQNIGNGAALSGWQGSTGDAIYAVNLFTGIAGYFESFSGNYSVYGLDGPVIGDNSTYGGDGVIGYTDSNGVDNGVWGINDDPDGVAILGGTNGVWVLPNNGSGVSGSSEKLGVFGYAADGDVDNANRGNAGGSFSLDSDGDPTNTNGRATAILAGFDNVAANGPPPGGDVLAAQDSYFGGYFSGGAEDSGTPSYAYVGLRHNTTDGTDGTDYKIIGPGNVSTLINDSNGKPRIMFSPEAPEIVFQDYGVGKLINGSVRINLDPILKGSLFINEQHPLKVYVTLEGDCNGIYVTDKSADGFTVKEIQGGTSNVSFSWQIVANRADTKDASGNIVSKHVGLRLPVGPTSLKPIEKKRKERKDPTRNKLKTSSERAKNIQPVDSENSNKSYIKIESEN